MIMKKKPILSFSALFIVPLIFSLALIGCESEATDESGVVPQGVGPDVFTSDPVYTMIIP